MITTTNSLLQGAYYDDGNNYYQGYTAVNIVAGEYNAGGAGGFGTGGNAGGANGAAGGFGAGGFGTGGAGGAGGLAWYG